MTTKHYYMGLEESGEVEAYLFIDAAEGANPLNLLSGLERESLVGWDAVRSQRFRLVLHLHGASGEELRMAENALVASHPALGARDLFLCRRPVLDDGSLRRIGNYEAALTGEAPGGAAAQAWLVLEIAPDSLAFLYSSLYVMEEVAVVEAEATGRRLLVLVQTASFELLGRVVKDRIAPLSGLAGLMELKVVPRDDMEE